MSKTIKNWEPLDKKLLQKTRVFDLMVERVRSPNGSYEDDFYYIETFDWVNVVTITENHEIVLVKQYRHGIHDLTLEVPGGMVNDTSEPVLEAGLRELKEETGYVPRETKSLGWVHPNPAIMTNKCFFYLALDARLEAEQNLDPAEDIAVELYPVRELPKLIADSKITHALAVTAVLRFLLSEGKRYDLDPGVL